MADMKIKFIGPNGKPMSPKGWSASHSSNECTAYAPIHHDGKVIALVVARGDYDDVLSPVLGAGTEIEKRFNTHDQLVDALISALPFLEDAKKSSDFKAGYVTGRIATVRAALAAAGAL